MIDQKYTKKKYHLTPVKKEPYIECEAVKGHAIWKGDWIREGKAGGLVFVNQKKME